MRVEALATTLLILLSPLTASSEDVDSKLFQAMEWRNIGPFRGGRSVASTGVASEPMTFYFGGVGGGIWKTTDGGETWTNVSDGQLATSSVGTIAVAPSDPNVIYVGMGEHAVRGVMTSHGDGVYRSTDAGKTWKHMGLPRSRAISRIRVHPTNPDLLYVAAQGAPYGPSEDRGVYRSKDGGATFEKILYVSPDAGPADLDMDPSNPRILYAAFWDHRRTPWEVRSGGPGSGLHKSTDGGDTWTNIGDDPKTGFPELKGKMSVAVSANPDRVYALVEADPKGGLYRSEDAGKTWKLVNETWGIRARAWYYINVFADPNNPDVVWITNANLLKSIDGGKTFERVQVPHGDNHHVWINPRNTDIMINSNDGGANVSFNGGKTWSTQQNQPTAQFYRVNTDNRFPYWVYGGQQDNTSVAIASQSFNGGIDWKDWYPVGGCESAYVAFDPDHPDLIYAGCYMGQITEWNARTRQERSVMAYPELPAALESRQMKYRFNWNAPIVASTHDPRVIYHAGNVLLRTSNRGVSWEEASPDLTTDDDEKQGKGGGPITNEGAGGEIYETIYYVAESPHDRNVIWTGSDDGLVHVTRDYGKHWDDVTPPGVGEAMVNAIEVSPHEPAKAYVAMTRYKFNDFTPLAFVTRDYGKTWKKIVTGIPEEAWVHVVREDPKRPGLLYMGTELGMYVSFDDGGHFHSLQLNLPVTPVTDLQVQRRENDLVAATAGRAFWILDDLGPLQQVTDEVKHAKAYLFAPRPATRVERGFSFGGAGRTGKNPPPGAIIDFVLDSVDESKEDSSSASASASLDILDEKGEVVRHYPEKPAGDGGDGGGDFFGPRAARWSPKAGMNRVSWDLRHESPERVPGLFVFGALRGRKVVPGTYQVRLTAGEVTMTQPLVVEKDPRLDTTLSAYREQDDFLRDVEADISEIHGGVNRLRKVRDQVEDFVKRAEGQPNSDAVREAGKALTDKMNAIEDELVQKRTVDGQTVINFPVKLNHHFIILDGAVDSSEEGLIDGARDRFRDLSAEWQTHKAALDELLGGELDRFNELVRESGLPAVLSPVPK
jgi:Sortilin, neurotensin receptor 3,